MARSEVEPFLSRIDGLIRDFERFAPQDTVGIDTFRAELAGLLVVSMAASYENCVKEVLSLYAERRHLDFHYFIDKNYERLNSRVKVSDLNRYCKLFGDQIHHSFKTNLRSRREKIDARMSKNIKTCYEQILDWRHDYAHSAVLNTTIEEASEFHMYGKRVIYAFADAFA